MKKKDKHIFKNLVFVLVAVMCVGMFTPNTVQAKGKVAMNKTKVTVCTKKSYTLKITNASKKVKWTTSDKKNLKIKPSGKKNENCKVTTSNKKGTYTVTAKVGKKKYKATVKVASHKYGKASYKWNSDYSKCTASKKCTRCGKTLKQTVKASSKTTTKATCTEAGTKKYTAKFTKYGFGTKNKSVSIKTLGHAFDKVSYKWNASYSACTAKAVCSRCNASVSEKATVTSKVTKQATKSATGIITYTATFKNKTFTTQTKNVTIPKLAYLEKEAIIIDYNNPMDVRVCNDTIDTIRFFDVSGKEVDGYNNALFYKIYGTISEDKTSVNFSTGYKTEENTLVAKIITTRGEVLSCSVSTKFTPGEYNFGMVNNLPTGGYRGYGKQKGTYGDEEYYIMDCYTKADYDAAYDFYHYQMRRDGTKCNLDQKSQEIKSACSERSLYKSKAELEWDKMSLQDKAIYDDDMWTYIKTTYGNVYWKYYQVIVFPNYIESIDGTKEYLTSNAQVKKIVTEWANTYNEGQMPSWYYYTAFSDWAEWSGRDINAGVYCDCPPLPDNFRD